MATKAIIPIKPPVPKDGVKLAWEGGRLVMEVQATIRIPLSFALDDLRNEMPRLTSREYQVLQGVVANLGNKQIGDKLGVGERTIKFHMTSLLRKFNLQSRIDLRDMMLQREVEAKDSEN